MTLTLFSPPEIHPIITFVGLYNRRHCADALNHTRQGTVVFWICGVLRDTDALQNLQRMNNRTEMQNIIHRTQLFCRVTETWALHTSRPVLRMRPGIPLLVLNALTEPTQKSARFQPESQPQELHAAVMEELSRRLRWDYQRLSSMQLKFSKLLCTHNWSLTQCSWSRVHLNMMTEMEAHKSNLKG